MPWSTDKSFKGAMEILVKQIKNSIKKCQQTHNHEASLDKLKTQLESLNNLVLHGRAVRENSRGNPLSGYPEWYGNEYYAGAIKTLITGLGLEPTVIENTSIQLFLDNVNDHQNRNTQPLPVATLHHQAIPQRAPIVPGVQLTNARPIPFTRGRPPELFGVTQAQVDGQRLQQSLLQDYQVALQATQQRAIDIQRIATQQRAPEAAATGHPQHRNHAAQPFRFPVLPPQMRAVQELPQRAAVQRQHHAALPAVVPLQPQAAVAAPLVHAPLPGAVTFITPSTPLDLNGVVTNLFELSREGNLETIESILQQPHANMNETRNNDTLLSLAALSGNPGLVEFYLKNNIQSLGNVAEQSANLLAIVNQNKPNADVLPILEMIMEQVTFLNRDKALCDIFRMGSKLGEEANYLNRALLLLHYITSIEIFLISINCILNSNYNKLIPLLLAHFLSVLRTRFEGAEHATKELILLSLKPLIRTCENKLKVELVDMLTTFREEIGANFPEYQSEKQKLRQEVTQLKRRLEEATPENNPKRRRLLVEALHERREPSFWAVSNTDDEVESNLVAAELDSTEDPFSLYTSTATTYEPPGR